MAPLPWYKEWFESPFYHKLNAERDEREAATFIRQLIGCLSPAPGSRMLEAGCGTGKYSSLLADMGFMVTGTDLSPENIATAGRDGKENPEFFVHDLRLPFWGNYFGYAFSFFTHFGYFNTRREHDASLRTIANSLQPGGRFVIDYLNVHYAEEHQVALQTKQVGDTLYTLHRWNDDTHFYKKISIADPSLDIPIEFTEKTTKFSLGDFTDMLSFQSLQVQEVFGDHQFGPYDVRKTPRLIIIAKKKGSESGDENKRLYGDGRKFDNLTI